ncbi:autotransporter outer membrane beta-barrel domain-containing protein [Amantichitinum ursilacus]|uniref:Outer membrane protein IcsA autotransporter n=1 Tax=Amantichitinum ursilacus TaxID=857265 RepID=A0A0N0XM66_9NEIS|nr:autotransporter outer membrane beta-barrel domain-containing protein [Amantichitinum ursilacus]KPC54425.1 Outer membrane protein IcsA autotransporter precursor [Amantichitinum ursilacus]
MNRIHKCVWSQAHNAWQVASELARGCGPTTAQPLCAVLGSAALASSMMLAGAAQAATPIPSATTTVKLTDLDASSTSFAAAADTVISASGAGLSGDKSRDWTITNAGKITGSTIGVSLSGKSAGGSRLDNAGTIEGKGFGAAGAGGGVVLLNGGMVHNQAGASIIGGSDGIHSDSADTAIVNEGAIVGSNQSGVHFNRGGTFTQAAGASTSGFYAVSVNASASEGAFMLDNAGTLVGTNANALSVRANTVSTVTNRQSGVIKATGSGDAIEVINGGDLALNNAGSISAVQAAGVRVDGTSTATLRNSGEISGATGVMLEGDGSQLINSGKLTGSAGDAISMAGKNNRATLVGGSNITGNISATGSGNVVQLGDDPLAAGQYAGSFGGQADLEVKSAWTLSGKGSQVRNAVVDGEANLTQAGDFTTQAAYTTHAKGKTTLALGSTLKVGGAFSQDADSALAMSIDKVAGTPVITAASARLGGSVTLSQSAKVQPTSATALSALNTTLIHTTSGISGDFANASVTMADGPDYLNARLGKSADQKDYNLSYGLAWLAGDAQANGRFTLANASDAFNVDVALDNQAANGSTWDGHSLTKAGAGTLTLSAANRYSGATRIEGGVLKTAIAQAFSSSNGLDIASGGTLMLNNFDQTAANLSGAGKVELGSATLKVVSAWDTRFDGAMSGSGGLIKSGTGVLELGGANSYSGATQVDSGTLRVLAASPAAGNVNIERGATLDLGFGNATYNNVLSGTGTVQVSGNALQLAGNNSNLTGTLHVLGSASASSDSNLGSAAIQLDGANSALTIAPTAGALTFNHALSGNGTLTTQLANKTDALVLGSNVGDQFAGTLAVARGTVALGTNAAAALSKATLQLDADSNASFDTNRSIGNLTLNGGTLQTASKDFVPVGVLTVGNLQASAGGTLAIDVPTSYAPQAAATNKSLFDQDDQVEQQVVKATGAVTGAGAQLALTRRDGSTLAGQQVDLLNDGQKVAVGTYNYTASVRDGADAGITLGYNLAQIDLQSGQALVLDNANAQDNKLGARITGSGDLHVNATGDVVLANAQSDYTGNTVLTQGNLVVGSNNALGNTQALTLSQSGSKVDLAGNTQQVGALNSVAGSVLDLNGGTLSIIDTLRLAGGNNGGLIAGTLTGAGNLYIDPSVVTITDANSGLTATTTLADGSEVRMAHVQGLGSGDIVLSGATDTLSLIAANGAAAQGDLANRISGAGVIHGEATTAINLTADNSGFSGEIKIDPNAQMTAAAAQNLGSSHISNDGKLELNTSADWTLSNAIAGSGTLVKTGGGALIVNEGLSYSGDTQLNSGVLIVGDASHANGRLDSTGTVQVASGATLSGHGVIAGAVINDGTIAALNGALLAAHNGGNAAGNLSVGKLTNNGVIDLTGQQVGNTLTVNGDYVGNGGLLRVNTVLGGDDSATDKLIITGNSSGNTNVEVLNAKGAGAQTVNGIEVIAVKGDSAGQFKLAGRAVAGAYEYDLYQGTPTQNDGNWYLRSQYTGPNPDIDPVPPAPPAPPVPPAPEKVRPEVGGYLANQYFASTLFNTTLHDRAGQTRFNETGSPFASQSSGWARIAGGEFDSHAAHNRISTDTDTSLVQLGVDLFDGQRDGQRLVAGVMTGYAKARSSSKAYKVDAKAESETSGYSVGVYATWLGNGQGNARRTGPYVDSWLQYAWFDNSVQGNALPEEKYRSHNWTASVEAGYDVPLVYGESGSFFLKPQAQLIYTAFSQSTHVEQNGTVVDSSDLTGLQSRLGVRVYGNMHDNSKTQTQPFVEANWLHASKVGAISMDGARIDNGVPSNRYEIKFGLERQQNPDWSWWFNVGFQNGGDGYQSLQGMFGSRNLW